MGFDELLIRSNNVKTFNNFRIIFTSGSVRNCIAKFARGPVSVESLIQKNLRAAE
jgi:hypothetical protein